MIAIVILTLKPSQNQLYSQICRFLEKTPVQKSGITKKKRALIELVNYMHIEISTN